ncbi:nucleoside phosphorylase [Lachnospiraceae bacterium 54-53]
MAEVMPHVKLSKEQAVPYALLPGDPARLDRIGDCLTDVEELAYNREYRSLKGRYRGIPVMAVSTGIGGASAAIAVEELARIGARAMIRIGSCGALQQGIRLGDLILVNGAVRDDGASASYVDSIYPAIPDTELLAACMEGARELGARFHVGIARSHDSFYIDEEEEICAYWEKKGVLGSDMETAALFVAGGLRGVKTASILNTVVERKESLEDNINSYTRGESAMMRGEHLEILTALEAFVRINQNHSGRK